MASVIFKTGSWFWGKICCIKISGEGVLRESKSLWWNLPGLGRALAIWIQVGLESGVCSSHVKVTPNVLTLVVVLQKAHWPLTNFSPSYQRLGKNTAFNFLFIPMREKMFNELLHAVMCQRAKREASQWNAVFCQAEHAPARKQTASSFIVPSHECAMQLWQIKLPDGAHRARHGESGHLRSLVNPETPVAWWEGPALQVGRWQKPSSLK